VIEHRHHIPAMSLTPVSIVNGLISYNFTSQNTYGSPAQPAQKSLESGVWGLYTGDGDQLADPVMATN